MDQFQFPTLRLAVLQGMVDLKERYDADPEFLREASCPYDPDTIAAIEKMFTPKIIEKMIEKPAGGGEARTRGRPKKEHKLSEEDQAMLEVHAGELLTTLNNLGSGEKEKGLTTSERIQIVKTKATLIEQVVKLRERFFNVKRMAQFQETVISILDDLVPEDARAEFLVRVDEFR